MRVQVSLVHVGERRLADQLRLSAYHRCWAFIRVSAADGAAAAPRADDDAGFEQGVARMPVAVLRPAQLSYQRGVANG